MPGQVRELLAQRATERVIGRDEEIDALMEAVREAGAAPVVLHVHGIAGIGKSSLLGAFAERARAAGVTVVRLDCPAIEPTERGFLRALAAAIGGDATGADEAARRLGTLGERVVLALDTYEVLGLLDSWLRQEFVPALGENVRIMLCGREPLGPAWLVAPEWQGLVQSITLGPLREDDAFALLERWGIGGSDARRINRSARGHPLALTLAATSVREHPQAELEDAALPGVVEELARVYLADIDDALTRRALQGACVVRRTTQSLLRAMLPEAAPQDAYDRLRALPFVESARDGLVVHDAVREAVAAALRSSDPSTFREYKRAAWRRLREEVRDAGPADLWRYTADMLYLVDNPVAREAFFPSDAQPVSVEPAALDDGPAIEAITRRHEGPEEAAALLGWWERHPQFFHSVRDRGGSVVGFYTLFEASAAPVRELRSDPVTRAWLEQERRNPAPRGQRTLFLRRWLTSEEGELPSTPQAACWLDIKRVYMELRPQLRRVYLTVRDLATYAPVATELGFRPIEQAHVELDGETYHTAMLDFGPASVDGWLAGLVAAELGVDDADGGLLDLDARELVLDGRRVGLTPLEFDLLRYLQEHAGKAMSHADLLRSVWGYDYEGSSNVDAAVVRSLRKKLAGRATLIETVRGVGYRFREQ